MVCACVYGINMQVSFPGVVCDTFQSLLEFLYTGTTSVECTADSLSTARCMDLIEVANRLCQPSLVGHVEGVVVDTLSTAAAADSTADLSDVVLSLLEPAQVTTALITLSLPVPTLKFKRCGALTPDGQIKLNQWQAQMTPCYEGRVNCTTSQVMRDTGPTCVVKRLLVRPEQMTGSL